MSRNLQTDGCGCCTHDHEVRLVGEVLMPDGKVIYQLHHAGSDRYWWYDKDLGNHWGDDWD